MSAAPNYRPGRDDVRLEDGDLCRTSALMLITLSFLRDDQREPKSCFRQNLSDARSHRATSTFSWFLSSAVAAVRTFQARLEAS